MPDSATQISQQQLFFDQFCAAWHSEYRQRGGSIYCGKGCSGCCSMVVNCAFPEAMQIASCMSGCNTDLLKTVVKQIKVIAESSDSLKCWLGNYRNQISRCVFLDLNEACSIYSLRPFSCRSLLSTKEARWCATDFSSLDSNEKYKFMKELDITAVAFPTHYASTPQEIGRELEEAALRNMESHYGFYITGNLPWLVWLETEYKLSDLLNKGSDSVKKFLKSKNADNHFLITIS